MMTPGALHLVEIVSALFTLTVFAMVMQFRSASHIRLYALQSLLLALLGVIDGVSSGDPEFWFGAGFTLLFKVILVPVFLHRLVARLDLRQEGAAYLPPSSTILLTGALTFLSFSLARDVIPPGAGRFFSLAAAFAGICGGLLLMVVRRKAVTQVFGLLTFENALQLVIYSLTGGMTLLVEVGVAFDLLVAVVALGVLVLRMRESFGDVDVARLRELRG